MALATQLQHRIGHHIAQWSRRRHGVDHSPLHISNRRIYILPTRLGLMYAVAVIAMGLGGMNYGNNLALMLAFLLAALGFVAMHHCHRNLVGLVVHNLANDAVFAGQVAHLQLAIDNPTAQRRFALQLEAGERCSTQVSVDGNAQVTLHSAVPTVHRGWLTVPRSTLCTRHPFGLFRGWTVLNFELRCLAYPKPSEARNTPPPTQLDAHNVQDLRRGDEEFAGLRSFHAGDSPTRIAWKAYAREQGLLVKQYGGTAMNTRVFDWDALAGLPTETRLAHLCRWIIDSHQQGTAYGLKLPGFNAAPALSEAHRSRCLSALAVFGGAA